MNIKIPITRHLSPHYVFNIMFDNSNGENEKTFNLYEDGVIKYLSDKMPLHEFDAIQIGLIRLIVSDSRIMHSEEELDKIFPLLELKAYERYEWQVQKNMFEWRKIDMKISDLKNKNYTVPPKEKVTFILFVREASMKDKLGL